MFLAAALLPGCGVILDIEPWAASATGAGGASSSSAISASSSTSSGCSMCAGTCVDLGADADNCGRCGTSCFGAMCIGGKCEAATIAHDDNGHLLAAFGDAIAIASSDKIAHYRKNGNLVALVGMTDGPVTAMAADESTLYVAEFGLHSLSADGTFRDLGQYQDPQGSIVDLQANAMSIAPFIGVERRVLISTSVTGRPLLSAPRMVKGAIVETSCVTSNTMIRVASFGVTTAVLATNGELLVCGEPPITVGPAPLDLAVVGDRPPTVVTAGKSQIQRIMNGQATTVIDDSNLSFLRVKARGDELFVLVDPAGGGHEVRVISLGSQASSTTLYTSAAALLDLDVDADGVYVLDKLGDVIAIGY